MKHTNEIIFTLLTILLNQFLKILNHRLQFNKNVKNESVQLERLNTTKKEFYLTLTLSLTLENFDSTIKIVRAKLCMDSLRSITISKL